MKKWLDAQYPEELPLTLITLLITISKRLIFEL
jgi:hypothetical protein